MGRFLPQFSTVPVSLQINGHVRDKKVMVSKSTANEFNIPEFILVPPLPLYLHHLLLIPVITPHVISPHLIRIAPTLCGARRPRTYNQW